MADPGKGPGGVAPPPPLLMLDETEARGAEKIFWETAPRPLYKGLDDCPPSLPPLSQRLDPALLNTPGLRLLLMAYVRTQINICLRSRKEGRRVNDL